jgi:predicted TIM-barrel fold metal-dependent hydrolase
VIIDAHCHAVEWREPSTAPISFGRYLARAARAGIARSVVFPGFSSDYRQANREVAELVARNAARLIGFACVHATRDAGRVHELLAEATSALGLRGIKVHRKDAPLSEEICVEARRFGLPILYDPVAAIAATLDLVADHSEVDFVIPHLGSFDDHFRAQLELIEALPMLPNLHTDSSAVRVFDLLQEALARAGPTKLLFGSDGPWLHPAIELAKIRALILPARDEALVLGGNLRRLLARRTRAQASGASRAPSAALGR